MTQIVPFKRSEPSTRPPEMLRLLLVEDNEGDAVLLHARLLEADWADFAVTHVRTLHAAVDGLAADTFDLVIADLNLPDSRALETVRALRSASPTSAIVVVSGLVKEGIRSAAIDAGAEEVIDKDEANSRLFSLAMLYVVERNRAERHRQRIERMFDASPDGVVVVGPAGEVKYVNESALRLFGRTRAAFSRSALGFSSREGVPVEIRIPNPAGERIGELQVTDFDWDGERALLASIRDVTEKKSMEVQLMMADRVLSVGLLAAGIAHEVNNPLTCVLANLELISGQLEQRPEGAGPGDDVLQELQDARDAAGRAREIVRDLRVFAHSSYDDAEAVDVHRVIESSLRIATVELRHRATVVRDFGQIPMARADQSRLGQVVLNLLVNAAQAVPEGEPDAHEVRIATGLDMVGRVAITVSDTGPGIPEHLHDRLFTPFFTTKPAGQGTGLGLAICKQIVTGFGGEISFETEIGHGTRFVVALPTAQPGEPPRAR